ncbi:MAG: response regulator [Anaerolineae bacterium]|nr:response regulator [Anaerolineae bacterium]
MQQSHHGIRGARVFMIEDNISNQSIAKMILESHGAQVEFNRWGKETVESLLNLIPVNLILLDMMFPDDISGFDIFTEIRSRPEPEIQAIPIVAVTAMDASSAVPRCRALGFDGYISKPINMSTFPKLIARILDGESVWEYR